MVRRSAVLLLPLALLGVALACNGTQIDHPCTDIPDGGCPLSNNLACEDPACEAVYLCRQNNVWELQRMCPPHDPGDAAVIYADATDVPSQPIVDATADAPPGAYGGPGCPDLQLGDCPLGVALSCGTSCCECEDLYVCQNGAWSYWGYCRGNGPVYSPSQHH